MLSRTNNRLFHRDDLRPGACTESWWADRLLQERRDLFMRRVWWEYESRMCLQRTSLYEPTATRLRASREKHHELDED
jgi:hypothetical protein